MFYVLALGTCATSPACSSGRDAAKGPGMPPAPASAAGTTSPGSGGAVPTEPPGGSSTGTGAGLDAGPADAGAGDVALIDQPGSRSRRCEVTREPEALGISPWQDGKLLATAQGLHLARTEGGVPGAGGFVPERLVVSPLGLDGALGTASVLGGSPGYRYGLPVVRDQGGLPQLIYTVEGPSEQYVEQVGLTESGAPAGAPTRLAIDSTLYGLPLPVEDGYLAVGGVYDELRTDNGSIWTQRLDAAGTPTGLQNTVVEASPTQRMANLAMQGVVRTGAGFLLLYAWYDATASVVDVSRYRFRFQALDSNGRPAGPSQDFEPGLASHITGTPQLLAHEGEVLVAWTEAEQPLLEVSRSPLILSPGAPLWSVIRVGRFDDTGALVGPARTVSPPPASGALPGGPYWVELADDEVGLGWYAGDGDLALCTTCWPMGTNYFVVLATDLQSARSSSTSFTLQTGDAGFMGSAGFPFGDEILVLGSLAHDLWSEGASATLRCTSNAP